MEKALFFTLCLLLLTFSWSHSQDNNALKVDKKIPVTGSEKFDIVFTRSIPIGKVQGVPYEVTRSGTYSIGMSYGIPMGKSLELKFEPRLLWHKLLFTAAEDKWFPSSDTSETLIYEKQRVSYFEVPVALKFKLARNLLDKYRFLMEMGFVFGRRLGSTSKTRHYSDVDSMGNVLGPKITVKINRIDHLNPFRFGPFLRIGTNWASVYAFYRMSDLFQPNRKFLDPYAPPFAIRVPYPHFSKLEIGVTLAL